MHDRAHYPPNQEISDPLDDIAEDTRQLIASGLHLHSKRMHAVQAEHTGSDTRFLDKIEEGRLAEAIQSGLASAAFLDTFTRDDYQALSRHQKAAFEDTLRQHIHTVVEGRRARNTLVECNLRFAAMLARQSMNIVTPLKTDDEDDQEIKRPHTQVRLIDDRLNITNLKSNRASLEDRVQLANLALITAAEKFKPGHKAKFPTYAAWYIYRALERQARDEETGGARLPENVYAEVQTAQSHPGEVEAARARTLSLYDSRRHSVPLSELTTGIIAPEEADSEWDEVPYLAPEDITADMRPQANIHDALDEAAHSKVLNEVIDTLGDREAGVIRLRFGITNGKDHTLDEIGLIYGVTRERIRQIESKTMSKLRHYSRSDRLKDFVDLSLDTHEYSATIIEGDAHASLRTANASRYSREQESRVAQRPTTIQPHLESWQTYPDEPWDMTEIQQTETSSSYEKAWFDLLVIMRELPYHLESNTALEFAETACEMIMRNTAGNLTASHIEHYWNTRLERFMRAQSPDADDLDHVGLLFSRLLRETLSLEDTVHLTIPPSLTGKIHFLGSELQTGTVEVNGSLGEYAGYNMGGSSRLIVHGSVGACGGNQMHDMAEIIIDGDSGTHTGNGSRDEAIIHVAGRIASLDVNPQLNREVTAGTIDKIHTKATILLSPFEQ